MYPFICLIYLLSQDCQMVSIGYSCVTAQNNHKTWVYVRVIEIHGFLHSAPELCGYTRGHL